MFAKIKRSWAKKRIGDKEQNILYARLSHEAYTKSFI